MKLLSIHQKTNIPMLRFDSPYELCMHWRVVLQYREPSTLQQ
jgi:hypothetical protein